MAEEAAAAEGSKQAAHPAAASWDINELEECHSLDLELHRHARMLEDREWNAHLLTKGGGKRK